MTGRPARAGVRAGCVGTGVALVAVLAGTPPAGPPGPPLPVPVAVTQQAPACLPAPPAVTTDVPWAQQQLRPERAWTATRGAGVVLGIVDSGVDGSVPQLAGRVLPGVDVTGGGPADTDCIGHGTFVAGVAAAAQRPDTAFAGVAPEATVLPVRITRDPESDQVDARALAAGIRAAVDRGAQVVNVSASTTDAAPELGAALDHAAAQDVVVVASAANGADAGGPPTLPAAHPSVIAVGAVDAAGARADFSQTGPHLSLAAPGVDVIGLGPGGPGHWQGSGTSFAAPFVSGTAALVRARHPGLTAEQVRQRLQATATAPAAALPDPGLGWGVVDPATAVTALLPAEGPTGTGGGAPLAPLAPQPAPRLGVVVVSTVAVVGALVAAAAARASTRLGGRGARRGWRPARTLRVR